MDKKKIKACAFLLIFVCLIIVYAVFVKKTPIEPSDNNYISVNFRDDKYQSKLEQLRENDGIISVNIYKIRNDDIPSLPVCENVENLELNEAKLNELDILEKFPNVKHLNILDPESMVLTGDVNASALESVWINNGKTSGIEKFACCPNLRKMTLRYAEFDGVEEYWPEGVRMRVLEDSSCFAELDTVESLWVQGVKIEDFSGFLEMDSLQHLYIDQDNLNQNNQNDIDALKSKGIQINE